MKLRYTGSQPFKIQVGDTIRQLQDGDIIDLKPWKLRASRLDALFEVAEEDPAKLTKAEKRFLKSKKGFADPELYTEREQTLEERLEEVEREKNKP